jgi:hypothetical protein
MSSIDLTAFAVLATGFLSWGAFAIAIIFGI